MSENKHIAALDGVRGVAVLTVMFYHFYESFQGTSRFEHAFYRLVCLGWSGVDLFFVLSGFLITRNLLLAKGGPNYFRNFFCRRALRIFPLYYALIAFFLFGLPLLAPTWNTSHINYYRENSWWLWLLGPNLLAARTVEHYFLYHLWSVGIEEQFYLLWPFVVFFTPEKYFLRVCGAFCATAILFRASLLLAGHDTQTVHLMLPARFDSFGIGGLLAFLNLAKTPNLDRLFRYTPALTVAVILSLYLERYSSIFTAFRHCFYFTALAAIFGMFITYAISPRKDRRFKCVRAITETRFLTTFGRYSYSLYLFHPILRDYLPISPPRFTAFFGSAFLGGLVYSCVLAVICLGCSVICWKIFEERFLGLGVHFTNRSESAGADTQRRVA